MQVAGRRQRLVAEGMGGTITCSFVAIKVVSFRV
jgi:hypothetical protein